VLFYSGDDAQAKAKIGKFIERLGFLVSILALSRLARGSCSFRVVRCRR
jgi:predicted dinucleotide-binding enzyme